MGILLGSCDPSFSLHTSEVCRSCGWTLDEHVLKGNDCRCRDFVGTGKKRTTFFSCPVGTIGPPISKEQDRTFQLRLDAVRRMPEEERTDTIHWRMESRVLSGEDVNAYVMVGSDASGNDLVAIRVEEIKKAVPPHEWMMCGPHVYFVSDKFVPDAEARERYCQCRETFLLMRQLEAEYVGYSKDVRGV